ncbi:hypothetical protein NDU88_006643 [Pleurodeles waltl]|uniref:Uncharacterized protein n=1 Tax=Pleurodeles waltl TaxID=8319 RepID=A0AAV7QIA8_PLEWA|nr:hypothetical protein NDU88_006643 [Pleurodeles waltl]
MPYSSLRSSSRQQALRFSALALPHAGPTSAPGPWVGPRALHRSRIALAAAISWCSQLPALGGIIIHSSLEAVPGWAVAVRLRSRIPEFPISAAYAMLVLATPLITQKP